MVGKRKRGRPSNSSSALRTRYVEEIAFDSSDRHSFLTGFRKRRLQRIKHAQAEAAKQEREDKIQQRKELREDRKREVGEHLEAVRKALDRAHDLPTDEESSKDDSQEEWNGFDDWNQTTAINHEDRYSDSDENKEAIVTIEAVNITRDGFARGKQDDLEIESEQDTGYFAKQHNERKKNPLAKDKHIWTKSKPILEKKKRKKFRYESVADRKENRAQQRAVKARKRAKREVK